MLELVDLDVRYGSVAAVRGLSTARRPRRDRRPDRAERRRASRRRCTRSWAWCPTHSGEIRLAGESLRGKRSPEVVARSGISLVPEGRRIFAELTVEENLRLGLSGRRSREGAGRRHRSGVRALPDRQGVPAPSAPARSPAASSSSSRSRARSSRGPKLLLLDEPSLGLAPKIVDVVFEALAEIRWRGITVLLVEQRAQRTVAFADRTYLHRERRDPPDDDARRRGDTGRWWRRTSRDRFLGVTPLASINAQVVVDAIGLGAIYALMAVGIGLVFGVLRLVNFAYGQLIMAGRLHARLHVGLAGRLEHRRVLRASSSRSRC